MADRTPHQGYTNYFTFLAALNIDSNEMDQTYWAEQAQNARDQSVTPSDAIYVLADQLKEEHEDHIETLNLTGWTADLMSAAMGEVDWRDLAEHLLSE